MTLRRTACVLIALVLSACALAAPPRSARADAFLRGSGVIRTSQAGEVVISIHSFEKSENVSGEVDHEFRFWSEAPLPEFNVAFRAAGVEYRGSQVLILLPDRQAYYGFVVDGAQHATPAAPAGFTGATFVGYGLNHATTRTESRIVESGDSVTIENVYHREFGDGSCDSGGIGATSCSATNDTTGSSCSATCSSGYYACCKKGGIMTKESCKCVKL